MPLGRREFATSRRLERAAGTIATATLEDPRLTWVRGLDADVRASMGLVVHAGVTGFVRWLRDPDETPADAGVALAAAPRAVIRHVTLANALDLYRASVRSVEAAIGDPAIVLSGTEGWIREGLLVYSREVAFAIAGVYASAAEERGAWDARLQAQVIDGLLMGDQQELAGRAGALGWTGAAPVTVLAARVAEERSEEAVDAVQRLARRAGLAAIAGMYGGDLVLVLGGTPDPLAVPGLAEQLAGRSLVVSEPVDSLETAAPAARSALHGLRASVAWPGAEQPARARDLLPERAMLGDPEALAELAARVPFRLAAAGETLVPTLACFLEEANSLEDCARRLFVHVNTVRYRLSQVADITGENPHSRRGAFVLKTGLAAGRLITEL